MTYKLTELIAASGQSVPGRILADGKVISLTAGTSISQYKLGTPTWSGEPQNYTQQTYNSGTVFNVVGTFSGYGNKFQHIRQNGNGQWSQLGTVLSDGVGTGLGTVTWNDGAGTVTVPATVYGEYDPNTLQSVTAWSAWFLGYTSPDRPADNDENPYTVRAFPTLTGAGSPSGSTVRTFQLRYANPDTGGFNPNNVESNLISVGVNKQAYPGFSTAYQVVYYSDSGYTTEITRDITSYRDTTHTWYVRYRLRPEYNGGSYGSWNNWGAVSWSDPRPDV